MNHPITPPPELVEQWENRIFDEQENVDVLLIEAYKAGADQELEACCKWLDERAVLNGATALRTARRPEPPSLKEQALESLERMQDQYPHLGNTKTIRRALEALPE